MESVILKEVLQHFVIKMRGNFLFLIIKNMFYTDKMISSAICFGSLIQITVAEGYLDTRIKLNAILDTVCFFICNSMLFVVSF